MTKKTALGVIFVLLAGAGVWWIATQNAPRGLDSLRGDASLRIGAENTAIFASIAGADRDNDGLRDWEEELWGTDSNNPDSDGDGTNDGDEVAADRHPARPAPGDELPRGSDASIEESIRQYLADETKTETEKISLELFRGYSALREQGLVGTPTEAALVTQLADRYTSISGKQYGVSDIRIVSANTDSREAYRGEVAKVTESFLSIGQSELVTLGQAVETGDRNKLTELDIAIAVYQNASKRLLLAAVPKDMVFEHLALVNSLSSLSAGISGMKLALSDPVAGITGVQQYVASTEQLTSAFAAFFIYLDSHQIAL